MHDLFLPSKAERSFCGYYIIFRWCVDTIAILRLLSVNVFDKYILAAERFTICRALIAKKGLIQLAKSCGEKAWATLNWLDIFSSKARLFWEDHHNSLPSAPESIQEVLPETQRNALTSSISAFNFPWIILLLPIPVSPWLPTISSPLPELTKSIAKRP